MASSISTVGSVGLLHVLCFVFFVFSEKQTICEIFVYLMVAALVAISFGIVGTLTMLAFSTVQYFAICDPLHHQEIASKRRIWIFITCSWILTLGSTLIPFVIMFTSVQSDECGEPMLESILFMTVLSTNVSIAVILLIYITMVLICLRIYAEIVKLQKRLSQFRYNQEMNNNQKAFVTTLILIGTLTLCFIPFATVYVVSLNSNSLEKMQSDVLIYYMNLLPYIKYLSDPLVYGTRNREIRKAFEKLIQKRALLINCLCWRSNEHIQVPTSIDEDTVRTHVHDVTIV